MRSIKIKSIVKQSLADTITPVSVYLKLRHLYPGTFLLESSDYHGNENSYSFICIEPIASFELKDQNAIIKYPGNIIENRDVRDSSEFKNHFNGFLNTFQVEYTSLKGPANGVWGYCSYNAVQYFDTLRFKESPNSKLYDIPDVHYTFFKYTIAINHYQDIMYITENLMEGEKSEIDRIETLINQLNVTPSGMFETVGVESSNISDDQYKDMVRKGKESCYRGDVFQIVLSRQFSQQYIGDDFTLYRSLRSINPSPYLFYFDYGQYRIFGSSPEAQIKIKNGRAYINPIAGTFRRTGEEESDRKLAEKLVQDIKENSEHVMLVDLARNDLSRHGSDVKVDNYREVQFYSHVIHLVSTVSSKLHELSSPIDMFTATFPAGTLSGAPKYKAMELIDTFENQPRGYYGGALGLIDFSGNVNHAIMIRTFLSKDHTLFYQAGAGIVAGSVEENELQEVNNKLGALKKAIENAKKY